MTPIGRLGHLETMSNGAPSAERPRGLHPDIFGPGGRGWHGVAEIVRPTLRHADFFVLDRPFGNEPDGSISDIGSVTAKKTLQPEWSRLLLDEHAMAAALGDIRHGLKGKAIWAYIGCPDREGKSAPDPVLMRMVQAGLIQGIAFDRMVMVPTDRWLFVVSTYERAGAMVGYEELPTRERKELWKNPTRACFGRTHTFKAEQDKIRTIPDPLHPNVSIDQEAIAGPIVLYDMHDDPIGSRAAMSIGQSIAANLLSPAWQDALTSPPQVPGSDT